MQEFEQMKRCLYRQWYPMRSKPTELDKRKTFNDLFKAKYGETLDEYHQKLKHEATMNFYQKAGR